MIFINKKCIVIYKYLHKKGCNANKIYIIVLQID
ncbi:MAG: hypothetical protein BWX61_00098 [Bacteroidetes bacterium ADurb.Bin035]|nr:MAG: hypothetical protein BWX61_00098 [Bacteroidetes bacterium ADurb.Bin035]